MTKGYAEFEFDLPEAQGVYQLLLRGELVYIGKTDAAKGLRQRLERHALTIRHRKNLSPDDVTFRAIRVFVFTAMDLEAQLISHYGGVAWQHSGFGSNDPGRNRDGTRLKAGGFDEKFPIDIDHPLDFEIPRLGQIGEILSELKKGLPYVFRYQALPKDVASTQLDLPSGILTTRTVLTSIIDNMPIRWQATDMYARLILYREAKDYEHGAVIRRSS